MATKKSKWRQKAVLQCEESWQVNYVMKVNKETFPKKVKKYCRQLRKHTSHKVVFKLK